MPRRWSKYKRSIDCKRRKGFSQKAHCRSRLKSKSRRRRRFRCATATEFTLGDLYDALVSKKPLLQPGITYYVGQKLHALSGDTHVFQSLEEGSNTLNLPALYPSVGDYLVLRTKAKGIPPTFRKDARLVTIDSTTSETNCS